MFFIDNGEHDIMLKHILSIGAATLACAALPAGAAQIVLNGSAIVGSTGGFDSRFTPDNIFDQQTGAIREGQFDGSYWLNVEGRPNAFITFDLGSAQTVGLFQLFNSRNQGDRGTAAFEIYAGNALVSATGSTTGATGQRLGPDGRKIVGGTLFMDRGDGRPLTAQEFMATDTTTAFRYLEFRPLGSINEAYGNRGYGLNELRVFEADAVTGAVPEPATWAMMIMGFGMVGGSLRRRKASGPAMA